MKIDHGFMTVYYGSTAPWKLPMVPIVVNCTTPPLMTTRQFYEFGVAIGNAIRSYDGVERVGLVAGGGLSHFVGEPRVGDIDEEFDRWFLDRLGKGDLSEILDLPNDELMDAVNGTEARSGPGWRSPPRCAGGSRPCCPTSRSTSGSTAWPW